MVARSYYGGPESGFYQVIAEDNLINMGSGYLGTSMYSNTLQYLSVTSIDDFWVHYDVSEYSLIQHEAGTQQVKDESNPQPQATSYSLTAYPNPGIQNGLYYEFVS
jgi:hypothetical protein